jgi:autotransporter-associated beta strand protein
MKLKLMAMIAAVAACVAGTAMARTIIVTENKSSNGLTTSFNLSFSADSATHSLWMAWGDSDGGTASIADWENSKPLGLVSGDMTAWPYAVPVPDGWGETVSHLRFVLIEGAGVPGAETLEYVAATGSQYVMTGFTPTSASAVEMTLAFNSDTSYGYKCLFCARGSSNQANSFSLFRNNADSWRWDFNTQNSQHTKLNPGTSIHAFRADSSGLAIDETAIANATATSFTAGGPMSIFAANNSGIYTSGFDGAFKLYSFKAWANGADASTIKLDLTPCRKTDGTVCLYNWADGTFLTVAEGSEELVASETVVAPAASVVPAASTSIVVAAMQGWETTGGAFYPYINPVYVVDVATGTSKAINEVTFLKMALNGGSVTTDVSYAEFIAENLTGTIIKRGGGTLTFDKDLSTFTGPVHVEDGVAIGVCSNCFGYTVNDNTPRDTQRTYVHSGATLVMDAVGNQPLRTEANAIYYEGDGYPGMGGALLVRNGDTASGYSRWQLGAKSRTAGSASLYVDLPSGAQVELSSGGNITGGVVPNSDFGLAGQELLVYGREAGSELVVNSVPIADIGDLVISNMTLRMSNTGYLSPSDGANSTVRFRGGSRWVWPKDYTSSGQTATLHVDDLEYASFGVSGAGNDGRGVDPWGPSDGKKYYWYNGPVVLNGNFSMFNAVDYYSGNNNSAGCTFESEVRGPGGFRPYYDERNRNRGNGARINLLYPTNTFEGGIVLASASLGVYGERAVPSHEGAGIVSITNGYVYFGRKVESTAVTNAWVDFTMPVTEFVNDGAVTNGTGVFKGLVKKGNGTLDYNSQMGGGYLDLQGGTVKFNTQYRSAYTGDNESAAPDGYAAALPVFTTLKGTTGTLDLSDAGGSWTVANVEGSPAVSGNLTVTGNWTVDAAAIGNNVANISGTLTFGEGATVTVTGDLESVQRPQGGFVIARAASISGLPRLVGCKGWTLQASNGELRLTKAGLIVIVR